MEGATEMFVPALNNAGGVNVTADVPNATVLVIRKSQTAYLSGNSSK